MNLCKNGHQEVCYEAGKCPVCTAFEELTEKIDDLEAEVKVADALVLELENAE